MRARSQILTRFKASTWAQFTMAFGATALVCASSLLIPTSKIDRSKSEPKASVAGVSPGISPDISIDSLYPSPSPSIAFLSVGSLIEAATEPQSPDFASLEPVPAHPFAQKVDRLDKILEAKAEREKRAIARAKQIAGRASIKKAKKRFAKKLNPIERELTAKVDEKTAVLNSFALLAGPEARNRFANLRPVKLAAPLEALLEKSFSEPALYEALPENEDTHLLATQKEISEEPHVGEIFGVYRQDHHTEIREKLAVWKKVAKELTTPPKPEPELVLPSAPKAQPLKVAEAKPVAPLVLSDGTPNLAAIEAHLGTKLGVEEKTPVRIRANDSDNEPTLVRKDGTPVVIPLASESAVTSLTSPAPAVASTQNKMVAASPQKNGPASSPSLKMTMAIAQNDIHAEVAKELPLNLPKPLPRVTRSVPEQLAVSVKPVPWPSEGRSNGRDNQDLFGRLSLDEDLQNELMAAKGYVELYIEPLDRSDGQPGDEQYVGGWYPTTEPFNVPFEQSADKLPDAGKLWAKFFRSGQAPVPVPFDQFLTGDTRKHIRFHVTRALYDYYKNEMPKIPNHEVDLKITLFGGGSGDHQAPPKIPNGKVTLIGMSEFASKFSNEYGNLDYSALPNQSEFLAHATSPGYLDTEAIIPVSNGVVKSEIYQLANDTIDMYTKDFTHSPQDLKTKSLVVGRVFDPRTKSPKEGVKVRMLFRRGKAAYIKFPFDAMLDHTPVNGLFGNFNIFPVGYRSVWQESSDKNVKYQPILFNAKVGLAPYIQPGRSGLKTVAGTVFDISQEKEIHPVSRIRVVGHEENDEGVFSKMTGRFAVHNFMNTMGQVTFEVDSPGYGLSYHDIAYDPQYHMDNTNLFLIDENDVKEAYEHFTKSAYQPERAGGRIFGQLRDNIFRDRTGCISVQLFDSTNHQISEEHGPFPWGHTKAEGREARPRCLTPDQNNFAFLKLNGALEHVLRITEEIKTWDSLKGTWITQLKLIRAHVRHVDDGHTTISVD